LVPTETPGGTRNDVVPVLMFLSDMSDILTRGAATHWETATAAHIQELATRPGVTITKVTTNKITQSLLDRRIRRSLQEGNVLQISFDANMTYTLEDNTPINAAELVADAFDSDADRTRYIERLTATDDPAFENVNSVEVLVEGTTPGEATDDSGNTMPIIIGAALGGVAVLALVAYLMFRKRRTKTKSEYIKNEVSPTEDTSPQKYSHEIVVDEQDDVSTLGGSVLAGMNYVEGAEDEPTASVNNDYDYVKQQYRSQCFEDTRSRAQTESSNPTFFSSESKMTGFMGKSLLADDGSFEDQYGDYDGKKGFEVEVPPGKLGMVVDTPNGGVPEVRAIKSDSVLFGRVIVGDQLLAVDEEDVTAMSAVEVSTLIARKAKQKRVLAFYRSSSQVDD